MCLAFVFYICMCATHVTFWNIQLSTVCHTWNYPKSTCAWNWMLNKISWIEHLDIRYIYDAGIHLLSRLHKNTKLLHFEDIQVISVCSILSTLTRVHDNAHGNGCLSLLELRLNVLLYYDRIMIKNLVLLPQNHSGIKIQEVIYVFSGIFQEMSESRPWDVHGNARDFI